MLTIRADGREEIAHCSLSYPRGSTEITVPRRHNKDRREKNTHTGRERETVVPAQTDLTNHCQKADRREAI